MISGGFHATRLVYWSAVGECQSCGALLAAGSALFWVGQRFFMAYTAGDPFQPVVQPFQPGVSEMAYHTVPKNVSKCNYY